MPVEAEGHSKTGDREAAHRRCSAGGGGRNGARSRDGHRAPQRGRGQAGRGSLSETISTHRIHTARVQSHPRARKTPSQSPRNPKEAQKTGTCCEDMASEGQLASSSARRRAGSRKSPQESTSPSGSHRPPTTRGPALTLDPRTPSACFPCSVVSAGGRAQQVQLCPSRLAPRPPGSGPRGLTVQVQDFTVPFPRTRAMPGKGGVPLGEAIVSITDSDLEPTVPQSHILELGARILPNLQGPQVGEEREVEAFLSMLLFGELPDTKNDVKGPPLGSLSP